MFFDQVDENGDPISMTPGVLLVPTSLKTVADLLYNEVTVNETTTANKPKPARNPHAGKFRPVPTPWLNAQSLGGSSDTAWYLLADPADAAVIEVVYLRGRRTPVIESEETAFNTLGMQWRGYFDFGVALQEHRAGVKSKGAGVGLSRFTHSLDSQIGSSRHEVIYCGAAACGRVRSGSRSPGTSSTDAPAVAEERYAGTRKPDGLVTSKAEDRSAPTGQVRGKIRMRDLTRLNDDECSRQQFCLVLSQDGQKQWGQTIRKDTLCSHLDNAGLAGLRGG